MSRVTLPSIVLTLLVTPTSAVLAQPDHQVPWDRAAQAADKAYWEAYNQANPDKMNKWLASDVEFYHDRGGKLLGKKALSEANNVMRTATVKLHREAVPGTVHFFPMRQGDTIYGAIVTGEHRFFARPEGKPEVLVGHANFSHLMLLQNNQWRIARIFSFEHMDAPGSSK